MFWRKKGDGFDWHQHIRTTIKLRREARRQKIDDVVDMAVGGLKGAGQASVAASSSGIDALSRTLTTPFTWLGRAISVSLEFLSSMLSRGLAPVGQMMERPGLAPILTLVGIVAVLLGIGRAQVDGWDVVALLLALGGLGILIAILAPPIFAGRGPAGVTSLASRVAGGWRRVPGLGGISPLVQRGLTGIVVFASIGVLGWLGSSWIGQVSRSTIAAIPGLSRPAVEGVASPISGDTLRVSNQVVRLSGIEAPELDQTCGGQGRGDNRWKCGEAARSQLRDLVRGKQVRCEVSGSGDRGVCRAGADDIGAEMVARGAAFAAQGLFASYSRQEQDARSAKRGLWKGSAERPDEYRGRLWETAKKAAPQGCPIKGQITRNERVYVVPWQSGYSRVRIRQDKGERWFCTEAEAQAAGFKRQGA